MENNTVGSCDKRKSSLASFTLPSLLLMNQALQMRNDPIPDAKLAPQSIQSLSCSARLPIMESVLTVIFLLNSDVKLIIMLKTGVRTHMHSK